MSKENEIHLIKMKADSLIQYAESLGVVVTIKLEP